MHKQNKHTSLAARNQEGNESTSATKIFQNRDGIYNLTGGIYKLNSTQHKRQLQHHAFYSAHPLKMCPSATQRVRKVPTY